MTSPGVIEYRQVSKPTAGPGQVRLKIQRIGICGSDVHVNHGKHPFTSYPVVQGHEYSAVVDEVGEGVDHIKAGAKVTAIPQVVCDRCGPCVRGDYHICDNLKVQGFQAPGTAQEFFIAEAKKVVVLPEDFSPEQGALVEPVSVAVHATLRAGNIKGKNVVVVGAGPIGNLVAQVCQARGAKALITEPSAFRLKIAGSCGIEHLSNSESETLEQASKRVFGSNGFDIALECVGSEEALAAPLEFINKGGTLVVVGVFGEKPRLDMALVQDRELSLVGTLMYQRKDYEEAVKLIALERIKIKPLETKHFPFEEYALAYEFIDEQRDKCMKVFIDL